ncbi:MAG: porin family protein [Gemmatimonadaceae bacterium]|nr:porin family protein [Gemmatimonadaceae bacterium]
MPSFRTLVAVATVALAATATPAAAQLSFGLGGGYTSPSGDLNQYQADGWNALATVQAGVPLLPVALRADLQYNSFGGKNFDFRNVRDQTDNSRIISGTVNAVWQVVPAGPIKPYVIGGVGYYASTYNRDAITDTFDERRFGWNAGAGVKFGLSGASLFIEARVHNVSDGGLPLNGGRTNARYIPVTVGIFF